MLDHKPAFVLNSSMNNLDARAHFPAFQNGFSFLDNAAGAQVPQQCIDAISRFLSTASCNVGMPYPGSQTATNIKIQTRLETSEFLNCKPSEVVIGTSATSLTFQLARAFSRIFKPGDEIIISELEHEANASPWRSLETQGVIIKIWRAKFPESRLDLDDLRALISSRTRLLAVCSAANSLGTAPDVAGAAAIAKTVGAWTITDMVHYAPHHLPDVQKLGVDFAVFSSYKVFSTHAAFMFVKEGLLEKLPADKLHFIPDDSLQKFEPGTTNHECLAGWLGTLEYLRTVLGGGATGRAGLQAAYTQIENLEQPLMEFALEKFKDIPGLSFYGEPSTSGRVGTFCINMPNLEPMQVAERLATVGVGVAAGHYYATMPMTALGLMPNGAVRVSVAHYNTKEDLEKLMGALKD
jgi:cysteine desulfurase family protein (TIGR01976 family)